ncbi:YczE/YyaS/YitT family protein [Vaginisenegalia massiliensis]|uniref:YczE/YyaS/YitT family protein n=1 Tax=Vaginisenegalia massiliensis TaxID=2058294 RepID=UPI000F538CEA|nr:hypothetical protein [Vaginisenegalia massiliensis]
MEEQSLKKFTFIEITLLIISILSVGVAGSFSLKAAIGVSAWDALAQTLSQLSTIKVGTIGMILNGLCVFGQIIILKKQTKLSTLLQIPITVLLGYVVNFVYYGILGNWNLTSYGLRFLVLLLAFSMICLAISMIMALDIITFPLEGFALVFANHFQLKFGQVRQAIDVISLALVIAATLIFKLPLFIREGTVLMALSFGPVLSWIIPRFKNFLYRLRFNSNKDYL